ncbi:MAG: GcvT family protein [Candidatus Puniceispirillaceae bacterium]
MSDNVENQGLPSSARVVIIGGGAVGVSALYHLALAGWTDCVLVEKNELTSGSTWHAAGNCPNFSANWAVMNMQNYSTNLYRELADRVDYPMNYHVSGSVRLAHSHNRMMEFEHVLEMARHRDIDMRMLSLSELQEIYPFVETHDLEGALYDPTDGDIDPAQLTQALAKGARDLGATIVRFCPVSAVRRDGTEWVITTEKGEIRCDYVVNAAGYRAGEVAQMFGRDLPIVSMSHQYLLTENTKELEDYSAKTGGKLPILRDVDSSYYLRQEKFGFNLGPYEENCRAHWIDASDPMPADFSFQLWQEDIDRISWHIEDAMARVPLLGEAGMSNVINGPIPYAPDGHPLIGPMPGVKGAFEACVFTFGIAQAGGAGKVLAEWVTEGTTEWDMWSCDPRRFTGFADEPYAIAKGMEVYGHEYAMHYPQHEWPAGRDKKCSTIHDRMLADGGVMGAYNGWERANWFAKQGDDTSEEATHTWSRSGPWEVRIKEEVEAVRDSVGVLNLVGFSRYNLDGEGAADWLSQQITGKLPAAGRMGLGYYCDAQGRIVTETSIMRHSENHFTLITAAVAQWHDFDWLSATLPEGVSLTDHTDDYSTLIISGPESRTLLSGMTDGDLDKAWLSHQPAMVAGAKAAIARVSFAGELGWEVHCLNDDLPAIYDAVIAGGAKPFGMYALNSMRIEKGYRAWKQDLSTDYTAIQAGLGRFIDFDKGDFVGRDALLAEKQAGADKVFTILTLEDHDYDAPYMSPVRMGDEIVGEITSCAMGYRSGKLVALAMVKPEAAIAGTEVTVGIFGAHVKATSQGSSAIWDPKNERLRA